MSEVPDRQRTHITLCQQYWKTTCRSWNMLWGSHFGLWIVSVPLPIFLSSCYLPEKLLLLLRLSSSNSMSGKPLLSHSGQKSFNHTSYILSLSLPNTLYDAQHIGALCLSAEWRTGEPIWMKRNGKVTTVWCDFLLKKNSPLNV